MKIRTREELVNYVNRGKKVKYLFFWGHQIKGNTVSKSCFSQWYTSPFNEGENQFATAEHCMMYGKAKLFGDTDAMEKALQAKNPGAVKAVGRSVKGFDQVVWNENKFDLVVKANLAKFSSNDELKAFLISTGKRVLVEASPVDKIWGIGLAEDNDAAQNPNLWKGENLLGFALMEVREQLQNAND
ncbi:NADAR family protein [Arenicella sp. 4NH20-0111]|uniref:NADAR family protein n=1 Tax=Arenicella sp. 4NH20-0111 TaxID=3127648 RepID=UPI00310596C6